MKSVTMATAVAAISAAMFASPAAVAAEAQIDFGYGLPQTSLQAYGLIIPWLDRIEDATNGEIRTEFLGGGSVVSFTTTLQALRDGLINGGMVYSPAYRKELPRNTLIADLGGIASARAPALAAASAIRAGECDDCISELREWNVVPMGAFATAPYDLLCRELIGSAEDMAGKRIRATGNLIAAAEELGGVPVNVSVSEVYESLQRGVVDCALADISWLDRFSLHEVVAQVIEVHAGVVLGTATLAVSGDLWDGVTDEQRAIMLNAAPYAVANAVMIEEGLLADAKKAHADKIDFVPAPDWALAALERARARVVADAVEAAKRSGVEDAQDLADTFISLYDKWARETEGRTFDQQELETFLRDAFYSRTTP